MEKNSSELVRLREAFRCLGEQARPTADCYPDERIWEAARGEAPVPLCRAIVEHIAECPVCAESWQLARYIAEDLGQEQENATTRRASFLYAIAAALLLFAVGVPAYQILIEPAAPPAYRQMQQSRIVRATGEVVPANSSELVLEWKLEPESPGVSYRIVVKKASDLSTVAEAESLAQPSFRLGPESMAALKGGEELLWQVEARFPNHRSLLSKTFRLRGE